MNRFRSDIDYIMGNDGTLRDTEGKTIINDDYRYKENNDNDSIELKRSIEQKKQELKELEKKEKEIKPSTGAVVSMDDKDVTAESGSASPIVSLLGTFN
jgi:hypothetical protein